MADGSSENRTGSKQVHELTFSAPGSEHGDSKKCSVQTFCEDTVNLSLFREPKTSDSCEKSDSRSVVVNDCTTIVTTNSQITREENRGDGDDRKKRCFDRYDSSESSDSGVAVLSPTESGGSSGSDITEPASPRSPESSCSTAEEGAGARMPPWASDPAPPASRRHAAQPAPVRRPQPPAHRRITEFFNHKMKPQNGLKRETNASNNEDTKRKCLPKNGVTHELEKYISYLSQTLSPKVLGMDIKKQSEVAAKKSSKSELNGVVNSTKLTDNAKIALSTNVNGRHKKSEEKYHTTVNGLVDASQQSKESLFKEKHLNGHLNAMVERKKISNEIKTKMATDPSANLITKNRSTGAAKRKSNAMSSDLTSVRIAPATSASHSPKKATTCKSDSRINGIVSSTTKLDSRMDGVTCGSNNLSLNSKSPTKKESSRKTSQPTKRTNRKSSACIANSKNLTWSKANNLKQLQQQNCVNSTQNQSVNNVSGEGNITPKMNIPNGVRQVPMTVNGSLGNINVPIANLQNCHQINIPQPCNGSVTPNNLASFVTVPPNVMLTTLRIPQNGIPAQTLTQQNNMTAFNRSNVNVTSPSKLNGQFVFPLMQNINGTVVQIPNLMAKMPNFVLPPTTQLTPRQDSLQNQLQNQQAAQILINGTLLKLSNSMTSPYPNVNKPAPVTNQPISAMNKNVPGIPSVGLTVQPKPNYTVNFSHTMLMPQPGYIVTSVPNMHAKETWSYANTHLPSSSQTSCSNPIVHHPPPLMTNFVSQALHSSSIPIAPVKPPDNPIQGTDPPSSTVNDINEFSDDSKCDIPWLSKTVNNNILALDSSKISSRPFAQVGLSEKFAESPISDIKPSLLEDEEDSNEDKKISEDIRKIEEVAKREETIFTQITVLKDICSNVQNTVIEANFCNATTESSESGIGTDKSIDSPSDSQTSKECDDDSSLSLSISVSSVEAQSSQKSPILKQPKTLRFPPRAPTKTESNKRTSSTDTTSTVTVCLWEKCKQEFESDTDLLEHLQTSHVESQIGQENFVCLWERCKVRGKPSCSRLWLQRHTLSHGGNKPFKCIVDGCDRRFSTQTLLERHVNNHFTEASPNAGGSKKTADSAAKLIRRNGKKLRYRRQPWSARMFDFVDAGMMEGLAWRLLRCSRWRVGGAWPLPEPPGRHTLTLSAACVATRYNPALRRREALLTYHPPHVVDDEWVPVKEVNKIKRVEIADLPTQSKVALYDAFCSSYAPSGMRERRTSTDPPPPSPPPPSGAKKRKMGRRHGGECFWPSGR
ncbi:hypothetical protein ACJJTC_016352 [Scirpophaga incertulas]